MICGLTAGGGLDTMRELKARRWEAARFSALRHRALDEARGQMDAIADAGMMPVPIVRDASHVLAIGPRYHGRAGAELWNEPDGTVDGHVGPYTYASKVPAFVDACHACGITPWVGVISNLNTSALDWLETMLRQVDKLSPGGLDFGVSAHIYQPPQWARFHSIRGGRPFAITEFGYHTAPRLRVRWLPRWGWNLTRYTDAQVAELARARFAECEREGATLACLYQYPDGPTDTAPNRFGIRRCDPATGALTSWKPVADVVPGA